MNYKCFFILYGLIRFYRSVVHLVPIKTIFTPKNTNFSCISRGHGSSMIHQNMLFGRTNTHLSSKEGREYNMKIVLFFCSRLTTKKQSIINNPST